MKATRKLIPAMAMLIVSAVVMSTASYAWFSMNTQVSATGMQVTAKSDNTFLLINTGDNNDAAKIQAANAVTIPLDVDSSDAKVYPSAPAGNATYTYSITKDETVGSKTYYKYDTSSKTFSTSTPTSNPKTEGFYERNSLTEVKDYTTADVANNWYTANGKSALATGYVADEGSIRSLTTFNGYVIKKTVYLTVAKGANGANNLKISATITQKSGGNDIDATKILITTDDGGFATLENGTATSVDIKGKNTTLTDLTVRTVNIYIYYDGNNENVYTNNAANLTGTDINLAFDVLAVPGE